MDVLRMIRWGMLAGFGFLLAMATLEILFTRPGGVEATGTGEGDITAQVWQVLAEARRIVEESS